MIKDEKKPSSSKDQTDSVSQQISDTTTTFMTTKKTRFLFIAQLLIVFIVVCSAIINLSLPNNEQNKDMWLALLCSAMGYMMPNPSFKMLYPAAVPGVLFTCN